MGKGLTNEEKLDRNLSVNEKMEKMKQEQREEILKMSVKDIELNTKYIIEFEDHGQDFLRWFIAEDGTVLDSQPCQRNIWVGSFTIPQTAEVGKQLAIWLNGESYVKYPIKKIKIMEVTN